MDLGYTGGTSVDFLGDMIYMMYSVRGMPVIGGTK
jgi:hypothetical protein